VTKKAVIREVIVERVAPPAGKCVRRTAASFKSAYVANSVSIEGRYLSPDDERELDKEDLRGEDESCSRRSACCRKRYRQPTHISSADRF
jgi:hypothetical protein